MLKSSDISVIVQGKVTGFTYGCLKSVRKFLPKSEIILSTWEGTDVSNLDFDVLVLSKDPGGTQFSTERDTPNSINRIIVSSRAGLKKATRKHTLLMRGDLILENSNILKFDDPYKRNPNCSLFKERIYAYEMYSLRFEERGGKKYNSIFHVSDWCRFGLTEDLQELFNIKTTKEPEFSTYFRTHSVDRSQDIWGDRMWKMSPEQYITCENAKKVFKTLRVRDCLDWREEVISASDQFIVNNFLVKSIKEWGIRIEKKPYKGETVYSPSITVNGAWLGIVWLECYQKYCDPEFILSLKYRWKRDLHIQKYVARFNKKLERLLNPRITFLKRTECLVGCLFYGIKTILSGVYHFPRLIRIKNERIPLILLVVSNFF